MKKPDFEALFRAAPYPYLVMDKTLIIIDANEAYLSATGRTRANLVGKWVFDAFPENPLDPASTNVRQVRSSLERAIATGNPDTTPFLRYAVSIAGGTDQAFDTRYWSTVHMPVFGADGEVAFVVQNAIDITCLYRPEKHTSQLATGGAAPETSWTTSRKSRLTRQSFAS